MTTKRQHRAEQRIERAARKKAARVSEFAYKVARRRLEDPKDGLCSGFCCMPDSLERPREEFLSEGQQLCGGAAVLFDRGVLNKLLPHWGCSERRSPIVLMATYVRELYREDGSRRDAYHSNSTFTSSGSNIRSNDNWI